MATKVSADYFRAMGLRDAPMKEELLKLFLHDAKPARDIEDKSRLDDGQLRVVVKYLKKRS
jgi:hypothetical protein